MSELRKDYIFDKWVIISEKRSKRPNEYKKHTINSNNLNSKTCFFCPGNEKKTGKETLKVTDSKGNWIIRCFENKFSAVTTRHRGKLRTKSILTSVPAYGYAEVIAETPSHTKQLTDLPTSHIKTLLEVYSKRISFYAKNKYINYVSVFKNHGREAGASIIHSHSQLIAYSQVPRNIRDEIQVLKSHKVCPYCKIIKLESNSKRMCFSNQNFVAIAPFASAYQYEVSIYPKKHLKSITQLNQKELFDLASILKKVLLKLKEIDAPYNMYMHGAHHHQNIHFHIEIKPRLNIFAGFELETGTIINTVSPEKAALFYRK